MPAFGEILLIVRWFWESPARLPSLISSSVSLARSLTMLSRHAALTGRAP